MQPAPTRSPTDGSTRHVHRRRRLAPLAARAPPPQGVGTGPPAITTQLYFVGGDYLETDVADAVKPELVLAPEPR